MSVKFELSSTVLTIAIHELSNGDRAYVHMDATATQLLNCDSKLGTVYQFLTFDKIRG